MGYFTYQLLRDLMRPIFWSRQERSRITTIHVLADKVEIGQFIGQILPLGKETKIVGDIGMIELAGYFGFFQHPSP